MPPDEAKDGPTARCRVGSPLPGANHHPGVATVTHTGGLCALADEWWALWRRCPQATPFQSPAWAMAWWRHFGSGGLWTITLRDEAGRLVGIAPVYLHCHDGLRTARLVGAGTSDYLDALAEPGAEAALVGALIKELDAHPERWDCAEFQQLPGGSAFLRSDGSHSDATTSGEPCPVVALAANERGELAAASARLCANLAADGRRLRRQAAGVAIVAAGADTVAAMLADLRRLHGARWALRGQQGVLGDEAVWRFHCEAVCALADAGIARLYALRANGRTIGVYYGFLAGRRAYYYLGGFDPAYRQFGIGNQLVAHAMAEARTAGAEIFDFLRGREGYKYRWGAKDNPTFSRRLYRDPVLRYGAPEIFHVRVGNIPAPAPSVLCSAQTSSP